jgi:hypothetical protein
MGLRYFSPTRSYNAQSQCQAASEKGLAASTIPEADNSLPHLIGDWSRPYGDWPLLFDASSFKVYASEFIQSRATTALPRLDIGGFSDRGSNPLVIRHPLPTVWICYETLLRASL